MTTETRYDRFFRPWLRWSPYFYVACFFTNAIVAIGVWRLGGGHGLVTYSVLGAILSLIGLNLVLELRHQRQRYDQNAAQIRAAGQELERLLSQPITINPRQPPP